MLLPLLAQSSLRVLQQQHQQKGGKKKGRGRCLLHTIGSMQVLLLLLKSRVLFSLTNPYF